MKYGNTEITLEDAIKILETRGLFVITKKEHHEHHYKGGCESTPYDNYIVKYNAHEEYSSIPAIVNGKLVKCNAVFDRCKIILDNHIKDMAVKSLLNLAETL